MLQRNVSLGQKIRLSSWRKTAIGTWKVVGDSQIYSILSVDAGPVLEYLSRHPNKSLTLTHVTGKICGLLVERFPEINSLIRWGNLYPRNDISVFFQVAPDNDGKELTGIAVKDIHKMSLDTVVEKMRPVIREIKNGNDHSYQKVKRTLSAIPSILMGQVLKFLGFILYGLNLWSPLLGTPQDSFGSMMVTNIGSLGMQTGWVPLVPWSRVPLILALGKVYEKPVVKNGEIVIQKTIDCCFTLDHRVIDGVVASKMAKYFEELFEHPEQIDETKN